ncbi:MAG: hypothetical protein ACRDE9_01400, partial [Candidatus Limnocylindria bacterium]
ARNRSARLHARSPSLCATRDPAPTDLRAIRHRRTDARPESDVNADSARIADARPESDANADSARIADARPESEPESP